MDLGVVYDEPKIGEKIILLINQLIEIKRLDHHLLFPMQCCMNPNKIDEVPKFLVPIPSETTHVIKIKSPSYFIHPIIILLQITRVASYFKVRKLTL